MKELLLAGPFIGSLKYEYCYFVPYILFLKKNRPDLELAVFTRPERFDLYGQYANYLVPLRLENDIEKDQIFYKSKNFDNIDYELLVKKIYYMYSQRFDKIAHIYPNIKDFYYQVKCQFPRNRMLYDFQPREENRLEINNLLKNKSPILIILSKNSSELFFKLDEVIKKNNELKNNYLFITDSDQTENFYNINNLNIIQNSTSIGYITEIIKKSQLVVSKKNDITNLAILMGIPTVIIGKKSRIFNPSNTEVTFCSEDNIINLLSTELSLTKKRNNNFDCI